MDHRFSVVAFKTHGRVLPFYLQKALTRGQERNQCLLKLASFKEHIGEYSKSTLCEIFVIKLDKSRNGLVDLSGNL